MSAGESPEDRERKKGLTKTAKRGNLSELLLRARRRQLKLLRREYLTKQVECGNLTKLLRHAERTEKSQKLLKKVLDKRNEVLYNSNVPPRAACTL